MALSKAQLAARDGKITASFIPALCAGREGVILAKWQELIGDPSFRPEPLDDLWPVQFGSFVEPFALDWHERRTQKELTRRGEVVTHPARPHVACTLDAFRAHDNTVLDCKVSSGQNDLDELLRYYLPQLLVQQECAGADHAALLVVHGGGEPQELAAFLTGEWTAQVWQTIDAFWECVLTLTPPVALPLPPTPPDRWQAINLDDEAIAARYNWTADMRVLAAQWADSTEAAKQNAEAAASIKALVPEDCGELQISPAGCGPVKVKRNRARALSIKLQEARR